MRFDLFDLPLARGNNIVIEEPGEPYSGDLGRYFDNVDPKKVDFYVFKLEITPRVMYERVIKRDGAYISIAFSDSEPDLQWTKLKRKRRFQLYSIASTYS